MNLDTSPGHPWNHGICACDCGACLRSCFCPCTLFGRTSYRLTHRDDVQMKGYHTCNASCLAWCGLCIIGYVPAVTLQAVRRCAMRQELLIDGNPVKDGCAAFWCQACVLVQDECEAQDWQKRKVPYATVQPVPRSQMHYPSTHSTQPAAPGVAHYGTAPTAPASTAQYGVTAPMASQPSPPVAITDPPMQEATPHIGPPPKY